MNEHEATIEEYLKLVRSCSGFRGVSFKDTDWTRGQHGLVYFGSADLLLQHAKFYKPPTVSEIKLTPRACFANCQYYAAYPFLRSKRHKIELTAGHTVGGVVEKPWQCVNCSQYFDRKPSKPGFCTTKKLRYVEGFALSVIPVHHAWCADEDGNAIECTWQKPGLAYFGLEFEPPKKFAGSMIDNGKDIEILKREWKGPR
jgi:hypothetical protein